MKKAFIFTLFGSFNYGNRLQNYALMSALKKLGVDAVSVNVDDRLKSQYSKKMKSAVKKSLAGFGIGKFKKKISDQAAFEKRSVIFDKFTDEYIEYITIPSYKSKIPEMENVDYAVTGSDQVWGWWMETEEERNFYYLSAFPKEKRIAYSASFGTDNIQPKDKSLHRTGLAGFLESNLSVREQSAADIVMELTGRSPQVVPDPTLLIERNEWETLAKKPSYHLPEKFSVKCMLECEEEIESDIPIVDIYNPEKGEQFVKTGPNEFLWLILNCEHVYTDSFHACVFSVLFHKRFTAYRRSKGDIMFVRIKNLLKTMGLEEFEYLDYIQEYGQENIKVDWDDIDERVKEQRMSGFDFLNNALGGSLIV